MNATIMPVKNSQAEIRLRRCENNLIIVGMGIMIFGLWNVVKTVSVLILNMSVFTEMLKEALYEIAPEAEIPIEFLFSVFLSTVLLALVSSIVIRLFIGFSAISVGKNKKKRTFYIPLSFAFVFLSAYEIYIEVADLITRMTGESEYVFMISDDPLLSIFIEITSLVMIIELLIGSFRIRKLRKEQNLSPSSEISIHGLHRISEELNDQSDVFKIVE